MDTRIIDNELANYGSFVKKVVKKDDLDLELDALQTPEETVSEEELLALGDFVSPVPESQVSAEEGSAQLDAPQSASAVTPPANHPAATEDLQLKAGKDDEPIAKIKHPIGIKLILIISLLVVFSMGVITVLVSYFISKDTRINAEDNNLTINSRTASDCQSRLNSVISSVKDFIYLSRKK